MPNPLILSVFFWLLAMGTAPAGAAPQRIVSLNLAADRLLLQLVAPERIAALSHLADDPELNPLHGLAADIPKVKGSAEAILQHSPDLVVAAAWGHQSTRNLLERRGVAIHILPFAESFAEIRQTIRDLAATLEAQDRGEELIDQMDRTLAAYPRSANGPQAVLFSHAGFSRGRHGIFAEILPHVGLASYTQGKGRIGIETLAVAPPAVVIEMPYRMNAPTLAWQKIAHPFFHSSRQTMPIVSLPSSFTICADNLSVGAIPWLRAQLQNAGVLP